MEFDDGNAKDDSLGPSDSWRGMPVKKEGVANRTNRLFRPSVVPPTNMVSYLSKIYVDGRGGQKIIFLLFLFQKQMYNLIIEQQQPKPTVNKQSNSNEAAQTQAIQTLIPSVRPIVNDDASDSSSLDFTQFINRKNVSSIRPSLKLLFLNVFFFLLCLNITASSFFSLLL